jgi:hypothetical protein
MRSCHPTTHNIASQLLEHRDPSFHKLPKRLGVQLLLDTRCLSATSNVIEDDSWVVLKSMWVLVYMVSFENAQNINDYRISPSFCAMIAISFVLHLLSTLLVYFLEPVVWPISKWLLNRIHTGGIEFCATHIFYVFVLRHNITQLDKKCNESRWTPCQIEKGPRILLAIRVQNIEADGWYDMTFSRQYSDCGIPPRNSN